MKSQSPKDAKLTVIDGGTEQIAKEIVDAAFKVHDHFGPGMLELIYEMALLKELKKRDIHAERQIEIPVFYEDELLDIGFRADIVVENKILLELKACEKLLPVHKAQGLSYIKHGKFPLGFLINFNVPIIKNGIVRIINKNFKAKES